MNRKVYFNDKFIEFVGENLQSTLNQSFKFEEGKEGEKQFLKLIHQFLIDQKNTSISISNIAFHKALHLLKNTFYYIEAAGGLIEKNGEFLFIRRHNRWDLPKGKLEKKETIEHAAVRECEEECGIKELTIIKPLSSTFHIYAYKDGFALKQSYWFYMQSTYAEKLVPQLEEDITEVRWFKQNEIQEIVLKDTYYTISDVVLEGVLKT